MTQQSKNNHSNNPLTSTWPEYELHDVVCDCMTVKRKEILPLINKISNVNDLVTCSGVGSVCTGCHPLLHEMMGVKLWTPVEITSIRQVSNDAKTFRFKSLEEPFEGADSGQHILLQAYIDGSWRLRRYTLTTPENETTYREITVQKEPNGLVSNWLFNLDKGENAGPNIRLSQSMGEIKFDLASTKSLVCLVGGIGVTPALSAVRSINQQSKQETNTRKIWIDYSTQNKDRLVYGNELSEYEKQSDDIHVNIRLTDKDGFINQENINEIVKSNLNGDFFVCGPPSFIEIISDYLTTAGVSKSSISVELFSVPEARVVKQSKSYFFLGLFLLAVFLVQDLFQLKIPWLETLQMNETYKIYSGLGLVLYLLMQFVLPYNKSCESPHVSANSYNRHKLRGIFTPVVFYIHSTQLGVAYLFVLSCVFFANILVGLFNHELISNPVKRLRYFKIWLPLHISLSILLVSLIAFHIFIVASY